MIEIRFKESTFVFDMVGEFDYYYQDIIPEVPPLLKQLDIKYEPDDKAKSKIEEVYKSSLTAVTIRGNATVLAQLDKSLQNRDDFFFFWADANPWFLSKYVDLRGMDSSEAAFLLEEYGDAIPKDLRAGIFDDLMA